MSYSKFCNDIWPFIWDEKKIYDESYEEGLMNFDQWNEIINKKIIDKRDITANDNVEIK